MRFLYRRRPAPTPASVRIQALVEDRDAHVREAQATASALLRVSGELSVLKDVVAKHIVDAGRPDSPLTDAPSMAASLQKAFRARGVDLRIELIQLGGRPL